MKKFIAPLLGIFIVFASCDREEVAPAPEVNPEVSEDMITVLENWNEEVTEDGIGKDGKQVEDGRFFRFIPTFFTLTKALYKTDLLKTALTGELTLFAPTDRAFAKLGIYPWNVGNVDNLTEILLYHVVGQPVFSSQLSAGFAPTLNGSAVEVTLGRRIFINDARVIRADRRTRNGVIHVINRVLLPPTDNLVETALSFDPEFSTLVSAVVAAGLAETLADGGPFTVFAPTNQAFADLGIDLSTLTAQQISDVLLYHVVSGRVYSSDLADGTVTTLNGDVTISVGDLTIDDAGSPDKANLIPELLNVQSTNGVIHVIDKVLIPAGLL